MKVAHLQQAVLLHSEPAETLYLMVKTTYTSEPLYMYMYQLAHSS